MNRISQSVSQAYRTARAAPMAPIKAAPPKAFCDAGALLLDVEKLNDALDVLEEAAAATMVVPKAEELEPELALATTLLSVPVTPAATVALAGIPVITPLESVSVV
jgi:hypothetical protein